MSVEARKHGVSPYRLALEHAQEALLASLTRRTDPESSVTISRNAKGVAQFEVTVRHTDIFACEQEARRIYDDLTTNYPYPATNGGTE